MVVGVRGTDGMMQEINKKDNSDRWTLTFEQEWSMFRRPIRIPGYDPVWLGYSRGKASKFRKSGNCGNWRRPVSLGIGNCGVDCGGTCRTMITWPCTPVCYLGGVDRRSHSGLIYSIIRKVVFLPLLCYKIFAWHHHRRSTWPLPGLTVSTMAQSLFQRYSGCMVALTSTKCKCVVE